MTKKMSNIDIKYINVPNICFSVISKDDKREKKFSKQRKTIGFDDSETWNLDLTIARFVLPRLKRFKEVTIAYPGSMTSEEWDEVLNKIICSFEILVSNGGIDLENFETYREGMELFYKCFQYLWW
ncbi:hypothetical protein M0R19_05345 [Candidatus Pacearchaeota archaeon]|nr:hypothetical protein [Candidatus Pacearchaeota archaeon]